MQNLTKIRQFWYLIVITALIFAMVGFGISKVQTPQYESTVQLLVIQKYGEQFDAFTAKRSAETVGETLSNVIYTGSFMKQVLSAPLDIEDTFSKDPEKRKKEWKKSINVKLLESGSLEVSVYQSDKKQAEQLAYGVAYILVTKSSEYHGGAQQIKIKMVERPITSQNPTRPNTLLNIIFGFLAGLLTSIGLIFLLPDDISFNKKGKKAEQKNIKLIEVKLQ